MVLCSPESQPERTRLGRWNHPRLEQTGNEPGIGQEILSGREKIPSRTNMTQYSIVFRLRERAVSSSCEWSGNSDVGHENFRLQDGMVIDIVGAVPALQLCQHRLKSCYRNRPVQPSWAIPASGGGMTADWPFLTRFLARRGCMHTSLSRGISLDSEKQRGNERKA